jgi:Fis family transcriptional regulator, factor for inversion stimulation protein
MNAQIQDHEAAAPADNLVFCQTLSSSVKQTVTNYLAQLDGHDPVQVYDMVLAEVEKPLLEVVLEYTRHNQSKAAKVLGVSRSTLRKKLEQYGLG